MLFPDLEAHVAPVRPRWIHLVITLDGGTRVVAVEVNAKTVLAETILSQAFFPMGIDLGHPEPLRAVLSFARDLTGPPGERPPTP